MRAVAEWEDRLLPMAEFAATEKPSPQVWQSIARQLGLNDARSESSSFWTRLRENLGFWRGLGIASTALATILVAVLVTGQLETVSPVTSYVAMLADDQARPIAVVTGDAKRRRLAVIMIASQSLAADKNLELWAVPREGSPNPNGPTGPIVFKGAWVQI